MLAKGPHRAAFVPHSIGVIGRSAAGIHQGFVRHVNPFHHRDSNLTRGDGRRGRAGEQDGERSEELPEGESIEATAQGADSGATPVQMGELGGLASEQRC